MSDSEQPNRKRGRPKGTPKKHCELRLTDKQRRDLDILRTIMLGKPTLNGIIEDAIESFVGEVLKDPVLNARYQNELNKFERKPRLVL